MCVALPVIAAVVGIAGTAFSAYGAYQQQQAANDQADYQAAIARNNAITAEREGQYAKEQSDELAARHRQKVQQFIGTQRAQQSNTGFLVDSGTALDLTLDTAEYGELDALEIEHEGDMSYWRSQIQADNYNSQAEIYKMQQSSPFLAATGELIGGTAGVIGDYARIKAIK